MKFHLIFSLLIMSYFTLVSNSIPVINQENVKLYLQKFGYFDDSTRYNSNAIVRQDELSAALKDLQRIAGLNQTGELDNDTFIIMVNLLRFGVKDEIVLSESAKMNRYVIHGSNEEPLSDEKPSLLHPDGPDVCENSKIDTVTLTKSGKTYFFKGDFYWEMVNDRIADGYPRKIAYDWVGLEGNLDAAYTLPNGKTYFFKWCRYWVFTDQKMDKGYPKPLNHEFEGIPSMFDTAFVWSGNGRIYFFKGDDYWRYDIEKYPRVGSHFPRSISSWWNIPDNIDAALNYHNVTYFFKGEKYYRYNDETGQVVDDHNPPFPRQTALWWFGCKSDSE